VNRQDIKVEIKDCKDGINEAIEDMEKNLKKNARIVVEVDDKNIINNKESNSSLKRDRDTSDDEIEIPTIKKARFNAPEAKEAFLQD